MTRRIKGLVEALLEALIEDGKAGIHNAAEDRDIDFAREQFDYLESALILLKQLEDNEEDFDFEEFGDQMCQVIHSSDVESTIYWWLDYADCTVGDNLDFTKNEVNELINLIKG